MIKNAFRIEKAQTFTLCNSYRWIKMHSELKRIHFNIHLYFWNLYFWKIWIHFNPFQFILVCWAGNERVNGLTKLETEMDLAEMQTVKVLFTLDKRKIKEMLRQTKNWHKPAFWTLAPQSTLIQHQTDQKNYWLCGERDHRASSMLLSARDIYPGVICF